VSVHGRIPYLEEIQADGAGRRKLSLEHFKPIARHTRQSGRDTTAIGLRVTHLVACPCVQNVSTCHRASAAGAYDAAPGDTMPLMTHSQRCVTTLIVHDVREARSFADMLGRVDDVLLRTCNTLSCDVELSLVYRAYREFIEDALRAAAVSVASLWPSGRRARPSGASWADRAAWNPFTATILPRR
jgi:GTP cyclohydrolase FolE2